MNILVTGGLGYIGSQVSIDLIKKGNKVIIIDNLHNSYLKNKPKNQYLLSLILQMLKY